MVRVAANSTKEKGIALQENLICQQVIYWIIILQIKIRRENFNMGTGVCVTTFMVFLHPTTRTEAILGLASA